MNELLEKLQRAVKSLSAEKGEVEFFGLFMREDAEQKWDIVAAASWLDPDERESLHFLVARLQAALAPEEWISIARVYILPRNRSVQSILGTTPPSGRFGEVHDCVFNGVRVKRAFVIASRAVRGAHLPMKKRHRRAG